MTAIWRPTLLPIDPSTAGDIGFSRMRVTSPYGNRPNPLSAGGVVFHDGLDIGNAREGDVVVADADGGVVAAGALGWPWSQPTTRYPSGNYGGFMVIIEHGSWVSVYAHMQPDLRVRAGQDVTLGTVLGDVGATGAASEGGAHLHYGHLMATVATIVALGSLRKPTRDPWTVIDPVGAMPLPPGPTELERKVEALHLMRRQKPRAARRWVERTAITAADEGRILTRLMRVTMELAALREAPEE